MIPNKWDILNKWVMEVYAPGKDLLSSWFNAMLMDPNRVTLFKPQVYRLKDAGHLIVDVRSWMDNVVMSIQTYEVWFE